MKDLNGIEIKIGDYLKIDNSSSLRVKKVVEITPIKIWVEYKSVKTWLTQHDMKNYARVISKEEALIYKLSE